MEWMGGMAEVCKKIPIVFLRIENVSIFRAMRGRKTLTVSSATAHCTVWKSVRENRGILRGRDNG